MEENEFLTTEEVAKRLRLTKLTIQRWASSGKLKSYTFGNRLRFKREDVDQLIRESESMIGPTPEPEE